MNKIYFCNHCRKIFIGDKDCACEGENCIHEVKKGTPVNIIGTKTKGKVIRIKEGAVELLIKNRGNKILRVCKVDEIRKIV